MLQGEGIGYVNKFSRVSSRIKSYVEYSVAKRLACRCRKPVPGISRTCSVIVEKRRLKARFLRYFFTFIMSYNVHEEWTQIADNVESPIRSRAYQRRRIVLPTLYSLSLGHAPRRPDTGKCLRALERVGYVTR